MKQARALCHLVCVICAIGCRPSSQSTDATPTAPPSSSNSSARPPDPRAEKLTNPNNLPPYSGPVGSIRGRVLTRGPAATETTADTQACPKAAAQYARSFREGAADSAGNRPVGDAVVVVTGYSGFYIPEKRGDVRVSFRECDFDTHAITMTFGQRLEIVNQGDVPFAPRLLPSPPAVLLIAPPQERGEPVHLTPERPGFFRMVDQLNKLKYLDVSVYVLLHPLHAVSKLDGTFRLDGVPAQKLTVSGRLANGDRAGSREVNVPAGGVVDIDLPIEPKSASGPSAQ